MKNLKVIALLGLSVLLAAGCGAKNTNPAQEASAAAEEAAAAAEKEVETTADATETETEAEGSGTADSANASAAEAITLPDGEYQAKFDTDSGMFSVNEACEGMGTLTVKDGEMMIHVSLKSKKIINLYPGLAEDAAKEGAKLLEPTLDTVTYKDGTSEEVFGFDVPVPVLGEEFDLALIGTKEKWYDHKVIVTVPDVEMTSGQSASGASAKAGTTALCAPVLLEGGTGKVTITSPAMLREENGAYFAEIIFSSPNYDYMIVNGAELKPFSNDGCSIYEVPVDLSVADLAISADTTAMGTPHLIDYVLHFDFAALEGARSKAWDASSAGAKSESAAQSGSTASEAKTGSTESAAQSGSTAPAARTVGSHMELLYAEQFSVAYPEEGAALITIGGTDRYLLLDEGKAVPESWKKQKEVAVIHKPVDRIYLAASSAMDMFRELKALDAVKLTATSADSWSIPEVKQSIGSGKIQYSGKYSAPDYEAIVSADCGLAIESTMIYHSPEVKEQLEALGLPVLVERSSYEAEPLGRLEWIKLYGLLTGREAEAEAFFAEKAAMAAKIAEAPAAGKSVVFFYIGSNGMVNVRKPGDYISKMIRMAGGTYAFDSIKDDGGSNSTMNMDMESFYASAVDADILIYNATTTGDVQSLKELVGKNGMLADFKAVKNSAVWCTEQNMFQQTTCMADMIADFHTVISGADADNLTFLHPLK